VSEGKPPGPGAAAAAWVGQRASESAPPPGVGAVSSLCLELLAPRRRVWLGEPVVLIVSLQNCSRAERAVHDLLDPEYRFLVTFVTRPGEKSEVRHEPAVVRDARGKRSRTLAPGGRLTAWVPLYWDRRGWFLRRPGSYSVRSVLAIEDGRLESSHATVEVAASQSEAEERAAEILMSPEVGGSLLQGGTPGDKGWPKLSALLRKYPESRLAPYARLAIGMSRTHPFFDPTTKTFRKADCPRAVEDLQWALKRLEDALFAAKGTLALSQCLKALGRAGEAREAASAYFRSHPEARNLPGVAEMFQAAASKAGR